MAGVAVQCREQRRGCRQQWQSLEGGGEWGSVVGELGLGKERERTKREKAMGGLRLQGGKNKIGSIRV